jgi:8-oxo-dGTP pyrophosphatase MutT (NUDIX family)
MNCALREWEEETGYDKQSVRLINNVLPLEETFMGSNYKTYKHKYYLGYFRKNEYMDDDISIDKFQKSEVSDMRWVSYEEAIELIRPYNIEKINMLDDINKTLLGYRLIS